MKCLTSSIANPPDIRLSEPRLPIKKGASDVLDNREYVPPLNSQMEPLMRFKTEKALPPAPGL